MRNVSTKGRILLLINLQYHKTDSLIHYCEFYCSKQKLCCYTEYVQHKQSNLFINTQIYYAEIYYKSVFNTMRHRYKHP